MTTLSIVTTTTQRPWCFEQLEDYYRSQTIVPDQWLVVGENHDGYSFTCNQEVFKRKPKKSEKGHSLGLNWLAAIPKITSDYVIVMEDDDYFYPGYFKVMVDMLLAGASLVGLQNCVYYSVRQRRFQKLHNMNHAALTCTGFTRELLPTIKKHAKGESVYLDYHTWLDWKGSKSMTDNLLNNQKPLYHVGLKGCPGLGGCGSFHSQSLGSLDWGGTRLREWIGRDCSRYNHLFEGYH